MSAERTFDASTSVAIVGLAGRFPGARDVEQFWRNLCEGVESVRTFTDEELTASGVPSSSLESPTFVKAGAVLDGIKEFDASFFGYSPREATLMDPQHRIFLECAWEALENAACVPERFDGSIGVFGGCGAPSYLVYNLLPHAGLATSENVLTLMNGNAKDSLATRVAYRMNLKGPAVTIQTACSTSLVAVHMACQAVLSYQCDVALAGGISAFTPSCTGYEFRKGEILSPDGHCRAFDARAEGTVFGSGVGIVVLKRLEDALAAGDHVVAVIRGSAINNDGGQKAGFTAPSIEGQAEVVAMAHSMASVDARSITYVEAHGTGTSLGDPVEIAALTKAFRTTTDERQFCAIGSVKTNVGHLDSASGVVGLIKAALAVERGVLPASLHFDQPNPRIDFANSPFFVNDRARTWETNGSPRRAGVSSFGIGGTNAHMVLEQPPAPEVASAKTRRFAVLPLSARTRTALSAVAGRLADHLEASDEAALHDVARTLQVGRAALDARAHVVCVDRSEAVSRLREIAGTSLTARDAIEREVVFAFPGQGSQYPGMARDVYESEPVFRAAIDRIAAIVAPRLSHDLRELLYPSANAPEPAIDLRRTEYAQVAIFAVEYALAQLWMHWGLRPVGVLGHSLGEYTAACVAGVMSLEDTLSVLVTRGALMQQTAPGAMLVVAAPVDDVLPLLEGELAIAAVNAAKQCVVSGPADEVDSLATVLRGRGVAATLLPTEQAFHSSRMEPVLAPFAAAMRAIPLSVPSIPMLSNLTGAWISPEEATSPDYWVRHLRGTVRFADNVAAALAAPNRLLLEVGPGQTLTQLARTQLAPGDSRVVVASLPSQAAAGTTLATLSDAVGRAWASGARVSWDAVAAGESFRRVPLPTYPFERQEFWVEPPKLRGLARARTDAPRSAPSLHAAEERPTSASLHARPRMATPFVAARSEAERAIARIFEELLGIADLGVDDNFFELGGDSLIAARLVARIVERFAVPLEVRAIFDAPTPAALARLVEKPAELLSDLLAMVEGLSEEEAEALLEQKLNQRTGEDEAGPPSARRVS